MIHAQALDTIARAGTHEISVAAPKLDWPLLVVGMALLWVTGIVAAFVPALRASNVPPEIATRTV